MKVYVCEHCKYVTRYYTDLERQGSDIITVKKGKKKRVLCQRNCPKCNSNIFRIYEG